MPLPERDASSYGPRARRHYRRFRITRPVEPEQSSGDLPSQRIEGPRRARKTRTQPNSSLWLLIVLAITVFTFICLIMMIIGTRWLVTSL